MGLLTRHRLRNVAIDVALLFVAWYAAFFFRFDTLAPYWAHLRDVAGWRFVGVQVAVLIVMRVYERWWKYTSLRDVLSLARALVVAEIVAYASMWLIPPIDRGANDPLPRGVVVLNLVLAGLLLVAARALARIVSERSTSWCPPSPISPIRSGGPRSSGRYRRGSWSRQRTSTPHSASPRRRSQNPEPSRSNWLSPACRWSRPTRCRQSSTSPWGGEF